MSKLQAALYERRTLDTQKFPALIECRYSRRRDYLKSGGIAPAARGRCALLLDRNIAFLYLEIRPMQFTVSESFR